MFMYDTNLMKTLLGIVLILVIGITAAMYFSDTPADDAESGTMTNAELIEGELEEPIVAEDVEYFEGATGFFVRPEATGSYPGVVMIHENRGLRPEIRTAAETLAGEGYMVLAVDLLSDVAEDQDGARALTANFVQATGTENMRAAVAYLRAQGAERVGSWGWCFGGRQSVELAISGETLDATVVYYGGRMATSTERLAPIAWPVLGVFGDQDQSIPVEMVRTFESSLNELGVENEIYIYPGVGHAFANPSGMNYAPEATIDAWEKTLAFLERHLKGIE
jgi:carboxymethylenebutenolidase